MQFLKLFGCNLLKAYQDLYIHIEWPHYKISNLTPCKKFGIDHTTNHDKDLKNAHELYLINPWIVFTYRKCSILFAGNNFTFDVWTWLLSIITNAVPISNDLNTYRRSVLLVTLWFLKCTHAVPSAYP